MAVPQLKNAIRILNPRNERVQVRAARRYGQVNKIDLPDGAPENDPVNSPPYRATQAIALVNPTRTDATTETRTVTFEEFAQTGTTRTSENTQSGDRRQDSVELVLSRLPGGDISVEDKEAAKDDISFIFLETSQHSLTRSLREALVSEKLKFVLTEGLRSAGEAISEVYTTAIRIKDALDSTEATGRSTADAR